MTLCIYILMVELNIWIISNLLNVAVICYKACLLIDVQMSWYAVNIMNLLGTILGIQKKYVTKSKASLDFYVS